MSPLHCHLLERSGHDLLRESDCLGNETGLDRARLPSASQISSTPVIEDNADHLQEQVALVNMIKAISFDAEHSSLSLL
jgi:hypothetical protein